MSIWERIKEIGPEILMLPFLIVVLLLKKITGDKTPLFG